MLRLLFLTCFLEATLAGWGHIPISDYYPGSGISLQTTAFIDLELTNSKFGICYQGTYGNDFENERFVSDLGIGKRYTFQNGTYRIFENDKGIEECFLIPDYTYHSEALDKMMALKTNCGEVLDQYSGYVRDTDDTMIYFEVFMNKILKIPFRFRFVRNLPRRRNIIGSCPPIVEVEITVNLLIDFRVKAPPASFFQLPSSCFHPFDYKESFCSLNP